MSSIFTKIINGEIPSFKIAEDDKHFAFLDINPQAKGHTLVIPKVEIDYIFDLSDKAISDLHVFAKKVAIAIKKSIECQRVGMQVIGTEVPHAHIHLIPFQNEKQMSLTSPKMKLSNEEMEIIATSIASNF